MSFLQGIIDSFNSVFSPQSIDQNSSSSSQTNLSASSSMEVSPSSVSNERVAYKLKGYYDLATQEIDKAVRAEEWGLIDDAILHYRNAHRILLEANSTPVPSFITSRFAFYHRCLLY
jgi:spastin